MLSVFYLSAANFRVQMSYCTFYSPSSGPYIEVYLSFVTDSIEYVQSNRDYYGEIDVSYFFEEKGRNVKMEQFLIQTPFVNDPKQTLPPFVSQHRIFLENGDYTMKISIRDKNNPGKAVETEESISLNYNDNFLKLSDIELFQSSKTSNSESMFQKNGFEIIPYAYDIIPIELNQIGFYVELYNADKLLGKDSAFLITYYLEDYEDGTVVPGFRGFSRKNASEVNIIMGKFLIGNLSGGNYNIRIDVHNKKNELVTYKKVAFHKENPIIKPLDDYTKTFVERYESADSLSKHIKYLQPIADNLEWEFAENQLRENNLVLMKKYFLNFWQQRDAENPEKAWYDYLHQVHITNENFGTPMREGYLSDRGYRYLKYGPPDDRYESFDEPTAYPYEVWYYTQVKQQKNKMIIFCNKSQVLNDYTILHSDINGEFYNKDWNLELHRMNPGVYDDEDPRFRDHFGSKADNWTDLPR